MNALVTFRGQFMWLFSNLVCKDFSGMYYLRAQREVNVVIIIKKNATIKKLLWHQTFIFFVCQYLHSTVRTVHY